LLSGVSKLSDQEVSNFDNSFLEPILADNRTHLRMVANTDKLKIIPLYERLVESLVKKMSSKDPETIRFLFSIFFLSFFFFFFFFLLNGLVC
jgi:hypothetical protein